MTAQQILQKNDESQSLEFHYNPLTGGCQIVGMDCDGHLFYDCITKQTFEALVRRKLLVESSHNTASHTIRQYYLRRLL